MTSISLYGTHGQVDEKHPAPAHGHPKDRRIDLKQIQAGLGVAADGGIPVFHHLVGDSKLLSHTNVTAIIRANVTFLAPLAASRVPDGLLAGLDPAEAAFVKYTAERDENARFWDRGTYRVCEDTKDLTGARKKDPVHQVRRILVYSSANATGRSTRPPTTPTPPPLAGTPC
ncbi:MAG: hypothetical protein HKP61_17295 [Dactylosporangium sp.]|nr:hypothetical protein [Dactylosporangium sp.]NNJ62662.1 hypothetical protein [Dactylosporangium sp.]